MSPFLERSVAPLTGRPRRLRNRRRVTSLRLHSMSHSVRALSRKVPVSPFHNCPPILLDPTRRRPARRRVLRG